MNLALLAAAALAFSAPAFAHHGFGVEFDAHAPVLLKGKVTKVQLINPHAWIHMEVKKAGRKPQAWMIEGGSPNTLLRAGVTKDSLKVGTEIVVHGYQSWDKSCKPACFANGRQITFPDGRKVFVGATGTGAPADGLDPKEPAPNDGKTIEWKPM
jgi:hypothetical protein